MNPVVKTIASPNQNIALNNATPMNPGIRNATVFSTNSIDAILAVSPKNATFAAFFNESVFSIGIIVNA